MNYFSWDRPISQLYMINDYCYLYDLYAYCSVQFVQLLLFIVGSLDRLIIIMDRTAVVHSFTYMSSRTLLTSTSTIAVDK